MSDELAARFAEARKSERHLTVQETRYWCAQYKQIAQALLAQPAQQEPVGKVLSEEEKGIMYDRRLGPVMWLSKLQPGFLYAAPQSDPTIAEALNTIRDLREQVARLEKNAIPPVLIQWAKLSEDDDTEWSDGYEAARSYVHMQLRPAIDAAIVAAVNPTAPPPQ